jgi:hypothetical protein
MDLIDDDHLPGQPGVANGDEPGRKRSNQQLIDSAHHERGEHRAFSTSEPLRCLNLAERLRPDRKRPALGVVGGKLARVIGIDRDEPLRLETPLKLSVTSVPLSSPVCQGNGVIARLPLEPGADAIEHLVPGRLRRQPYENPVAAELLREHLGSSEGRLGLSLARWRLNDHQSGAHGEPSQLHCSDLKWARLKVRSSITATKPSANEPSRIP